MKRLLAALLALPLAGCPAPPPAPKESTTSVKPPKPAATPAGRATAGPTAGPTEAPQGFGTMPPPSTPGPAGTPGPVGTTPPPGAAFACPSLTPGLLVTLAGGEEAAFMDGAGPEARFSRPSGIAAWRDKAGKRVLYVADYANHRIRRLVQASGSATVGGCAWVVNTAAGGEKGGLTDGLGEAARLSNPRGMAIDRNADPPVLYVADYGNHAIRMALLDGSPTLRLTTVAGNGREGLVDGAAGGAMFAYPAAIAVDGRGDLYVADSKNHRIRRLVRDEKGQWSVDTIAGDDAGLFAFPAGVAVAATAGTPASAAPSPKATPLPTIYVADTQHNRLMAIVSNEKGERSLQALAGDGRKSFADGTGNAAAFSFPGDMVLVGDRLVVADTQNQTLREVRFAAKTYQLRATSTVPVPGLGPVGDATVTTLAGDTGGGFADGIGGAARLRYPLGIAADEGQIYVADTDNHRVRRLTRSSLP